MQAGWELLIAYEVLTAAVREALPGYADGWVDFTEEAMLGCTVFHLWQEQLGDKLGQVRLRKLSEKRTELSTRGPQRLPGRSLTQEEEDSLKGAPQQRFLDVLRKIHNESDELNHRRKEHFNAVVKVLFNRLNEDVLLRRAIEASRPDTSKPAGTKGGARSGQRAGTDERVREFHRYRKAGHGVKETENLVGSDSRTYYKYCLKVTGEEPILD